MATTYDLIPRPSALSASLRDLGYSVETAVADIIDNSITACANKIDIYCDESSEPLVLAIIDNGKGMDKDTLLEALRPGTYGPNACRDEGDLGRYGLGLKTASFSQCRQLTVVSVQNGSRSGAEWDLDLVLKKDQWTVTVLSAREIAAVPHVKQLGENGTLVLWRKIDKFEAFQVPNILAKLSNHLELVFHRFLAGERNKVKKVTMAINKKPLFPFDPFMKEPEQRCQWKIQDEIFKIEEKDIVINAYTLPHFSKIPPDIEKKYRDRSDYYANQGFYVYRNCRLMCWGDWFRIISKQEKTKYSRVQIDFQSTLDHLWNIDIKKSVAIPPQCLRDRLKHLIEKIIEPSKKIINGRAIIQIKDNKFPIWERIEHRGGIDYAIKKDHELIKSIEVLLDEKGKKLFSSLIEFLSTSLPLQGIYADGTEKQLVSANITREQLYNKLSMLYLLLSSDGIPPDKQTFRNMAQTLPRLFGSVEGKEILEKYVKEQVS